jgi:hypothetical protein
MMPSGIYLNFADECSANRSRSAVVLERAWNSKTSAAAVGRESLSSAKVCTQQPVI